MYYLLMHLLLYVLEKLDICSFLKRLLSSLQALSQPALHLYVSHQSLPILIYHQKCHQQWRVFEIEVKLCYQMYGADEDF